MLVRCSHNWSYWCALKIGGRSCKETCWNCWRWERHGDRWAGQTTPGALLSLRVPATLSVLVPRFRRGSRGTLQWYRVRNKRKWPHYQGPWYKHCWAVYVSSLQWNRRGSVVEGRRASISASRSSHSIPVVGLQTWDAVTYHREEDPHHLENNRSAQ